MAKILRVTSRWTGFTGAPGFTVHHFRDFGGVDPVLSDAQAAVDKVDAFWIALMGLYPNPVGVTVQADVEAIDETNGVLQYILSTTPDPIHQGTGGGSTAYAAALGAVVSWTTAGIRNGRRVRGRTFLVPLLSTAFQNDGTLATTAVSTINTAATTFRDLTGIVDLAIWARPTAPGATDGVAHAVTTHNTPDMGAVLRSRRD